MRALSRRSFLQAATLVPALSRIPRPARRPTLAISTEGPETRLSFRGQPLLTYRHDPSPRKPYIRELAPPGGSNLLLDGPADHLHHHGLMYAIRANGVNFWEETQGCGAQIPSTPLESRIDTDHDGRPRASFRQSLLWQASASTKPDTDSALLVELRQLDATLDEDSRELALRWTSRFELGPRVPEVSLTGSNYNGLGVRFLRELDPIARHIIPNLPATLPPDTHVVTPGSWGAVAFHHPQSPATLALFASPHNARNPGHVFSMTQPFVYLALTQGLDIAPLPYHAGESFEVQFVVTLQPRLQTQGQLAERARSAFPR